MVLGLCCCGFGEILCWYDRVLTVLLSKYWISYKQYSDDKWRGFTVEEFEDMLMLMKNENENKERNRVGKKGDLLVCLYSMQNDVSNGIGIRGLGA